jgi:signal transduction histidine kinase
LASPRGRTPTGLWGDGSGGTLAAMRRERILDFALPLVVFVFTVLLLAAPETSAPGRAERELDALGAVLAAVISLPLYWVRRAPLIVFMVSTAASTLLYGLEYPGGPPIGPTVALFFVALAPAGTRAKRWLTPVVVVLFYAVHIGAYGLAHETFPHGEALLGIPLWGAVWLLGERTRQRRQRIDELVERATRAEQEAERERKLAAAEERTRIARDLHDSAGHAINVILVHAGAARLLAEKDPTRSREAIGTIESVARETLREIEQLVSALREDGDRAQTPIGLAALDALVRRHRDAGLDVHLRIDGPRRPLGPAVDQAAYRLLQESLTNALRHGTGVADVVLTYAGDALEIGVTNPAANGTGPAGHGIVGMRERASLLGGFLVAESDNGVFRVRARLPYDSEESS